MPSAVKKGPAKKRARKQRAVGQSEEAIRARARILEAAQEVFARKGFDGARVDEIAAVAGVNKALIYYYFASKDSLLEEMVNRLLQEMIAEKWQALDISPTLKGYVDETMARGIEITEKRMPILAVLCMEAMKGEDRRTALLQVFDRLLEGSIPIAEKLGFKKELMGRMHMPGFFFGFAPLFLYQVLKDAWVDYYKVDKNKMDKDFMRYFKDFYINIITFLLKEEGLPLPEGLK